MVSLHTLAVVVGVHFIELIYAALIYGLVAAWRTPDDSGWTIGMGVMILIMTALVWGGLAGA